MQVTRLSRIIDGTTKYSVYQPLYNVCLDPNTPMDAQNKMQHNSENRSCQSFWLTMVSA